MYCTHGIMRTIIVVSLHMQCLVFIYVLEYVYELLLAIYIHISLTCALSHYHHHSLATYIATYVCMYVVCRYIHEVVYNNHVLFFICIDSYDDSSSKVLIGVIVGVVSCAVIIIITVIINLIVWLYCFRKRLNTATGNYNKYKITILNTYVHTIWETKFWRKNVLANLVTLFQFSKIFCPISVLYLISFLIESTEGIQYCRGKRSLSHCNISPTGTFQTSLYHEQWSLHWKPTHLHKHSTNAWH